MVDWKVMTGTRTLQMFLIWTSPQPVLYSGHHAVSSSSLLVFKIRFHV